MNPRSVPRDQAAAESSTSSTRGATAGDADILSPFCVVTQRTRYEACTPACGRCERYHARIEGGNSSSAPGRNSRGAQKERLLETLPENSFLRHLVLPVNDDPCRRGAWRVGSARRRVDRSTPRG